MGTTLNVNQFRRAPAPGDLDLSYFGSEHVIAARYNPEETSGVTVESGEGIKLVDLGSTNDVAGPPIVDVRTADVQTIFGVRVRQAKSALTNPGEMVDVAVSGAVMWFKASAALNRGVKVSLVFGTPGMVQAIGTKAYLGYTLDKVASGGMVRVMLVCDAVTAGTT